MHIYRKPKNRMTAYDKHLLTEVAWRIAFCLVGLYAVALVGYNLYRSF